MKKPIWFKAKEYGYGWYPATWQGWLILLGYFILVILNFFRNDPNSYSESDIAIRFVLETLAMAVVLIVICYFTGEKPEWRWGNKKPKK